MTYMGFEITCSHLNGFCWDYGSFFNTLEECEKDIRDWHTTKKDEMNCQLEEGQLLDYYSQNQ